MAEHERARLTGYRGLWLAVLIQAVRDYRDGRGEYQTAHKRRFSAEAEGWFKSESIQMPAFIWVCMVLDLDPAAVRERVLPSRGRWHPRPPATAGRLPKAPKAESPNAIGRAIREYRRRERITQAEMARRVGCSGGAIGQFEARPGYGRTGSRYLPRIEELINGE